MNELLRSYVFVSLLFSIVCCSFGQETIKTKQGLVRGFPKKTYHNKTFIAFEGIPFAQPPIGSLRFKNPLPAKSWAGILNANNTYTCPQVLPLDVLVDNVLGQEDCLYLNVYVPQARFSKNVSNLDVIVHIHGGAFILGSPILVAGPRYIMNHDVIYVNFNYRLGILGFLSFLDNSAPGNLGLKDQNLALKWIRHNVGDFGGNAQSITVTGMSAGSASLHFHLLSQKSKGLFDKALCWSGTSLNPWVLWSKPKENARKLAQMFYCVGETTQEMVECLRKVPADALTESALNFTHFANVAPIAPFGPVIEHDHDEAFITEHPLDILRAGKVANDVPIIFGTTQDEGIFPIGYYQFLNKLPEIDNDWLKVMPYALEMANSIEESQWENVMTKIRRFYFGNDQISMKNIKNLTKLLSDRFFYLPLQNALKFHRNPSIYKSPVYVYYFSYDSPGFFIFPNVPGVAHCEDGQLVFDLVISPRDLVQQDEEMVRFMTALVVQYAKTSVPDVDWKHLNAGIGNGIQYWHVIDAKVQEMQTAEEFAPQAFWDTLNVDWRNGY